MADKLTASCPNCLTSLIEWKCVKCDVLFCDKCKNEHLQSFSFKKHTISRSLSASTGLNVGTCTQHANERCGLFCKTCDSLVCQVCLSEHINHEFSTVKTIFEEKLAQLKHMKSRFKDTLEMLNTQEENLDNTLDYNKAKFEEQNDRIKCKSDRLMEDLNTQTKSLQTSLMQRWGNFRTEISDHKQAIEQKRRELFENMQVVEETLKSNDVEEVCQVLTSMTAPVADENSSINGFVPEFRESRNTTVPVGELCKAGEDIIYARQQSNVAEHQEPLEMTDIIMSPLNSITTVLCSREETPSCIYAVSRKERTVMKLYYDGQIAKKIKEINNKPVLSLASLGPERFVFVIQGDSVVHRIHLKKQTIKGSLKIKQYYSFPIPQEPMSVCTSEHGNVTVATIEMVANDTRINKIITLTGQPVQLGNEFEIPIQKSFLPVKISQSVSSEILVIMKKEIDEQSDGIVCSFDMKSGQLRWHYEGTSGEEFQTEGFYPTDITTTSFGNVVVSDLCNDCLHFINTKGDLVKYVNTKLIKLENPLSLHRIGTSLFVGTKAIDDSYPSNICTLRLNGL